MGQVFLARDHTLDRPVAIKFLSAPQDPGARRRLLAEARAAAALDHPAICTVHAVVHDDEVGDFIVMAYVEGETLSARLARGPLAPSEAVALMGALLQALGLAHRAGVIHRDIKPQNIVLTSSGLPKLLDFGIAKRVGGVGMGEAATATLSSTAVGQVVGTLAYMSPEQARGQSVDARSDIFSLGCVLYECLTGRRPFDGQNLVEAIGQLLHVDPPLPSTVTAGVPAELDAICADMLRKVPAERFQSAEEVLGALRAFAPTPLTPPTGARAVTEARPLGRRRWALATAGLGGVAVLVTGWLWFGQPPARHVDPGALQHFNTGVEKLREGSYTGARLALMEAVRLSPDFVQAHLRLAEARAELDDGGGAQEALLRVNALMETTGRLPEDDRLRLEAVRSSVLREHAQAIEAYQRLADLAPGEASRWLDVGRAEDAAGRRVAALAHFERAVTLDSQYAAAHQRRGVLQSQGGQSAAAIESLDEAIRLHRINANREGEAEAMLRKAAVHIARRDLAEASAALVRVTDIVADPLYVSLRLRAQFEQARVAQAEGRFDDAERLARSAADEALGLRMGTIAADGLRSLATALMAVGRFEDADAQLGRAIDVAVEQKARRAEMQARLQRASLRLAQQRPADAIALVETALPFFAEGRYVRNEAEARSVLARAHESLEQYDQARVLASEVLTLAESLDDPVLIGVSLDNLAGQAERLGQLPEALAVRERLEQLHRDTQDHALLAFDLVNRADLLIRLGRGAEADDALAEVERAIAAGRKDYESRRPRMAVLRALQASVQGRFGDVEALALSVAGGDAPRPGDTALVARVLVEHARARLGRSRADVAVIAGWPGQATSPATGRELAYWVAETLLARGRADLARRVSSEALSAPAAGTNLELRWRLAAVAAKAGGGPSDSTDASMRTDARTDLQSLLTQWAAQGQSYASRADVAALRKGL
jgi:tetratricopeptide (TPR) repeat protein